MTKQQPNDGQWRDDRDLPLEDLIQAMATYSADGQVDDASGGDAGSEQALAHDPEATHGQRALRPSPEGHTGPV